MITKSRIGGLMLLIFCVFYALKIGDIRLLPFQANQAFTARTMPQALATLGILFSVLVIIFGGEKGTEDAPDTPKFSALNWQLGLAFLVLMSAYGLTVRPFGFLLSTSAFLMIGFAMLGERSLVRLAAVAIPLVVAFWVLMNYGLSVFIEPLPFFLRG